MASPDFGAVSARGEDSHGEGLNGSDVFLPFGVQAPESGSGGRKAGVPGGKEKWVAFM